jgi:hypothetical protein
LARLVPCLCALAAVSAADAPPAATKTVKLTMTGIPAPGLVMTGGVLQNAARRPFPLPMVSRGGTIIPNTAIIFGKDQTEQVMSLGGASFTFTVNPASQSFALKPEKGNPAPMKQQNEGYATIPLPLASKKKVALAFPYGRLNKIESMIAIRSGATAKGALDGEAINLLDDNIDGSYDGTDLIAIGASNCYAPLGKRIATKKGVYALGELDADGAKIAFTPDAAATVPVSFKFAGEGQGHAAFASADGDLVLTTTGVNEAFKLPPGSYKLLYGAVYGQANKVCAVMLPDKLQPFTVTSDGDTKKKPVIAYGGPFAFAFTARFAGGKITVTPDVKLYGAGGEQYMDFRWQGTPTVYVNGKQNGSMGFG